MYIKLYSFIQSNNLLLIISDNFPKNTGLQLSRRTTRTPGTRTRGTRTRSSLTTSEVNTSVVPTVTLCPTQPQPNISRILLINSRKDSFLIEETGGVTKTSFEYEQGTAVRESCAITWKNKHYVYGGLPYSSQISQGEEHLYFTFLCLKLSPL